jgi:uncharacterized protein
MNIQPIASDSLGVRSMAVFVQTKDCKILIDPSAALGPKRYNLPPCDIEIQTLEQTKQEIRKKAEQTDIFTISHYHYDHYDPYEEFYTGKTVFAKDIKQQINASQKQRGRDFSKLVKETCNLTYADDSTHTFGDTTITFSPPFFHGPTNVKLGYVLMVTIEDTATRILHASDVQGPVTSEAKDYIISQKPDLLIMDGPPTIFLGWRFSQQNLQDSSNNLLEIIEKTGCKVILDHHLLRDRYYQNHFPEPYNKHPNSIQTFAEYLGKKNNTLEAQRKELWEKQKEN